MTDSASRPAATASPPLVDDKGTIDQTAVKVSVFRGLLDKHGLRDALYALLRQTDYRFISIFRFSEGKATSVVHVDRHNLLVTQAAEVPETATYCCYVRDRNGVFVTADTLQDPRTVGHVAREVIRSYCGVPILQDDGTLIGTLCHYDTEPRNPDQLDMELLLQSASLIARSGKVPDYPRPA